MESLQRFPVARITILKGGRLFEKGSDRKLRESKEEVRIAQREVQDANARTVVLQTEIEIHNLCTRWTRKALEMHRGYWRRVANETLLENTTTFLQNTFRVECASELAERDNRGLKRRVEELLEVDKVQGNAYRIR